MEEKVNKKILIFCMGGIGDTLMAFPMIKKLKQSYQNFQIDVACMFEGSAYACRGNSDINEAIHLPLYNNFFGGIWRSVGLRKKKYDISMLTFPAYRREYHLVQWFVGAKKRFAHRFKKGFLSELHFLNTGLIDVDESVHNLINNLNLLDLFMENKIGNTGKNGNAKKDDTLEYSLVLNNEDREFGERFIKEIGWEKENIIGIHPGSTNSPAALLRRWPADRYVEVIKFLKEKTRAKVLIFLGREESGLVKGFQSLEDDSCKLIYGNGFGKTLGILSQIKLLICNDNGFGHLAVALKKPIVTLWASTNDKWSLPYGKDLVTLIRPPNFTPWYRYDLKRRKPNLVEGGIDRIQTEEVIDCLREKLLNN